MPPVEDSADRLLLRGFSGCFGFNGLFKAALRANGFDADTVVVTAIAPATHFLIKNWEFNTVSPGSAPWSSEITLDSLYGGAFWTMVPFATVYGASFNKEGKGGQGEPWPSEKFFQNHQIVKWFGVYYDPSYGLRYADANTFQALSVDGVARPSSVVDTFLVQKVVPGGPILVQFDN